MRRIHVGRAGSVDVDARGSKRDKGRHPRSRYVASCTALAALLAGAIAAPAAVAGPPPPGPGGEFSCQASALRLSGLLKAEPLVANPANAPCQTDSKGLIGPLNLGPLTINGVLTARTEATAAGGHAESSVTRAVIGIGPVISADVLTSQANVSCVEGEPVFSSSGDVVNVKLGTLVIQIPAGQRPLVLSIPLVGTLYLNEVVTTPTSITRRALRLDTLLLDVVIAESIADVRDKPCEKSPPPPKPQCSDGIDNDGDYTVDEQDPGCLSGPNGAYNPSDDDEQDTPPAEPQCSDGTDNDGDKKIDMYDPQCDNPEDDDESK